jgi:hypothetical protein
MHLRCWSVKRAPTVRRMVAPNPGMPDEILSTGDVREVGPTIERMRADAEARIGWVVNTYLLRRRDA